jgi:hypothetical protein
VRVAGTGLMDIAALGTLHRGVLLWFPKHLLELPLCMWLCGFLKSPPKAPHTADGGDRGIHYSL